VPVTRVRPCDVLVLGGGPAGCVVAGKLGERGHRVVLVQRRAFHATGPYESLLAAGRTLLHKAGLADWFEAAAEIDTLRHGALWEQPAMVWRDDPEPGLLLRRGPFDQDLREGLRARGVQVVAPAVATPRGDGTWAWQPDGGENEGPLRLFAPQLVVDARGRSALRADAVGLAGARTFAFGCVGEPAAADRGTAVVEALADGWIWMHAPHDGPACATAMVDADAAAREARANVLARLLASARGPASRLRGWRVQHATEATPRRQRDHGDLLAVGDAAATIDPLASQGVEKAIAAGDHAAAVADAVLRQPEQRARLLAMHARWEQGVQAAHQRTAAEWYRRAARFAGEPFWQMRATPLAAASAALPAHDALLQPAPWLVRGDVLVREGPTFVARAGATDTRTGDEASHVGYVPIPALLDRFVVPSTLAAATAAGATDPRLFVLPPRAVHAALLELLRRGWLTPAPNAAGSR
jgi:2-polyprenyl-6-methoxyphenol hydroxylase-like FAD-dependent oxidoreductase